MKRILVADDDEDIVLLLRVGLELKGCEVIEASDGRAALDAARDMLPDLVVLDVMMPELDGFEVLIELKSSARTRDIPVVILTAKSSDQDVWEGWQAGADYYITKPFDIEDLMRYVSYIDVTTPAAG